MTRLRKVAKFSLKFMPLVIVLSGLTAFGYIKTAQAEVRWQSTTGSTLPSQIKPGRLKFLSPFVIVDTATGAEYKSSATPDNIFHNDAGSLFNGDKAWWFWPKDKQLKAKDAGKGACYGAIYVHTYKENSSGLGGLVPNRPVHSEVGLVTPVKNSRGECKIYDDGNPRTVSGAIDVSDGNFADGRAILKWDQFNQGDVKRLSTPFYWPDDSKGETIKMWKLSRQLTKITGGTREDVLKLTQKTTSDASKYSFYTTKECNGSYDIPNAWVAVDLNPNGGTSRDAAEVYYKKGSGSSKQWSGENTKCLFGRDIEQGPRMLTGGDSRSGSLGIDYPENAKTEQEIDQENAVKKSAAVRPILAADINKLLFCYKAAYGRDAVFSGPNSGARARQEFISRYADYLAGVTSTDDPKVLAVMDCAKTAYGDALKSALDKTYVSDTTTPTEDNGDEAPTYKCKIDGVLGWILTPICDAATWATITVGDTITDILYISPITQDGTSGSIYDAWKSFRDVANAFLVLVFLIAIFAQVLPIDIDSYTVKKILPRIIAATIAIQLSYFICQIMIDISNVLGFGVKSIFEAVVPVATTGGIGTNIINGGLTAAIGAGVTIAFIGPVLMLIGAALISMITVIVTVQLRQVIIILLVLASPLAILAWTLPNTENYAKKWGQNFIKLLLMYPLIQAILSGSQMIGQVLQPIVSDNTMQQILVACIPVAAFFMIPATFKASGAIMGAVATKGFGKSRALAGKAGAGGKEQVKGLKDNFQRTMALAGADKKNDAGLRFGARMLSGAGILGSLGAGKRARFQNAKRAEEGLAEEMKLITNQLTEEGLNGDNASLKDWLLEKPRSKAEQIAAMQMLGNNGGIEELSAIYEEMEKRNGGKPNAQWNEADRDVWQQGTTTARQALAKALPYSVRPDHEKAFGKLDAEGFASLKGVAGKYGHMSRGLGAIRADRDNAKLAMDAAQKAGNTAEYEKQQEIFNNKQSQLQKAFTSMVGVGQSTDRRGRIDADVVKDWAQAVRNGDFDGIDLDVGGQTINAREFVDTYVTENNQLRAVPTANAAEIERGVETDEASPE